MNERMNHGPQNVHCRIARDSHGHRPAPILPDAATATAALPTLELTLTDTGFEIAQPLMAGRYEVTVSNTGASTESHFGLAKIPDAVSDAQYQEWLDSEEGETEALTFEDIAVVGVPDWPAPGGSTSGVVDLAPGKYFLFNPFDGHEARTLMVEGDAASATDPTADVAGVLREMEIVLPETAFTSHPVHWKIENTGAISHEVAVIPVWSDFTDEHLQMLFSLPEDATPPAGVPEFVYQPVAAIGILAGQHTSWLDVHLKPRRYLAARMLPFGTGYPHAIDGMYHFFDVE